MFYYLSGWEMRHSHTGGSQLPGSLWAGVCDYDQFWSLAGRVAQSVEAMPNFSFLLCNFEEKPAVLCTYIV